MVTCVLLAFGFIAEWSGWPGARAYKHASLYGWDVTMVNVRSVGALSVPVSVATEWRRPRVTPSIYR